MQNETLITRFQLENQKLGQEFSEKPMTETSKFSHQVATPK
jgi:hypothetical protein